mgnify:FL=1
MNIIETLEKEQLRRIRCKRIILAVQLDAHTRLAMVHAERPAQIDLLFRGVVVDQAFQSLHYLARTFQVAGTPNAYRDVHVSPPTFRIQLI